MNKVFCNNLQPGTRIRITSSRGKKSTHTVRQYIPINKTNEPVFDVEILLIKSRNIYFSYNMYSDGTSWVKDIEVLKRLK